MIAKKDIRKQMRQEKSQHDRAELKTLSQALCAKLLKHPQVLNAQVVLLYWALPDEVCCDNVVTTLAKMGKTVLLPKVVSDTMMTVHRFTSVADMTKGAFGILEPTGANIEIETLRHLDDKAKEAEKGLVAVVPGMAFDREGHRLGRGKGYYDRFLAQLPDAYRIGVCFPFQLIDEVPTEESDVVMNEVIY